MNLLIVESPNKIKKLKSLLGTGWDVAASVGHIRDLPAKSLSIDKANGYKMLYEINADKKDVVTSLKKKVNEVGKENVYLATDPDREGEAISFHLCQALGLDFKKAKRVTFQELTDKVVKAAVAQPRTIDLNLVSAQESRRAIDRLVGYEISPVLWRKLESGLSAGRVQSVALRMTVERERVITSFVDRFNFQVFGFFKTAKNDILKAKKKETFASDTDAETYLHASVSKIFTVTDIVTKPIEKAPQPPYSTSSLQQDGVKKLKMNVKRVMDVAQKLFEGGHITYMRTDSLNLSDTAIAEAKVQIEKQYGSSYFQERHFKSKAGAQEAHEAIRPTHWENPAAGETQEEQKLYDLIYRRALASQMKPAKFDETTITITSNVPNDIFTSTARVLTFDGYLKVYQEEVDDSDEENGTISPVKVGEVVDMQKLEARQVYAKPPKRFDQATLVAELEKKQIGRPSTYASILNTILYREYVKTGDAPGRQVVATTLTLEKGAITRSQKNETLGADKNKLIPTEKGTRLTDFMEGNFNKVVDYQFTAKCEDLFDEVAEGKRKFADLVPAFDRRLAEWVTHVQQTYSDVVVADNLRELGLFEEHPVKVGKGKFGTFVRHQNVNYSAKELKEDKITLEEAIQLIELKRAAKPKGLGNFEGKPLQVGKGPYGTYILHDRKYYNIEGKEPEEITDAEAIAAIEAKRTQLAQQKEEQAKSLVKKIGKKYELHNGQYGLYVTDGTTKAKLPTTVTAEEAATWTAAQCKERIQSYLKWKKQNKK
jgi:DNA topoisomerase-1